MFTLVLFVLLLLVALGALALSLMSKSKALPRLVAAISGALAVLILAIGMVVIVPTQ